MAKSRNEVLAKSNKLLARQWHPTKNEGISPKDVTSGSNKKVWWQCGKGHEWQATPKDRRRASGGGCPCCSGKIAAKDNCLRTVMPALAQEWHPARNAALTPKDVTPGSNKKVWWLCRKGHEWQAVINSRSTGLGCPYCSRKKVNEENCLATVRPELAKEWHPTRNLPLTPKDVVPGSNKNIWWLCREGHEWKTAVCNRTGGNGCPYCSGRRTTKEKCLKTVRPDLAKEWHPAKNAPLTPKEVAPGSSKKVWWLCKKGHEWNAYILNRRRGDGCPYCSGRRATRENCLATVRPLLVKEWHPTRNAPLTPKDVKPGSEKEVWWQCRKGHEWQETVAYRSQRGRGCPVCIIKAKSIRKSY